MLQSQVNQSFRFDAWNHHVRIDDEFTAVKLRKSGDVLDRHLAVFFNRPRIDAVAAEMVLFVRRELSHRMVLWHPAGMGLYARFKDPEGNITVVAGRGTNLKVSLKVSDTFRLKYCLFLKND